MDQTKKLTVSAEVVYFVSLILMGLAVAMVAAADFGVSMVVAPAYILSLKISFLTFGQGEYVVQSVLFIIMCLLMKKIKPVYFFAFLTCVIYGLILDVWRMAIPLLNASITPPGSMAMPIRIVLFVCGVTLTAFAVALGFHTYLFPQVNDFFVKAVSGHFKMPVSKFKTIFDFINLFVSCVLTLAFFGKFRGIGVGTVIITFVNGFLIGFFDKLLAKYMVSVPISEKFSHFFDI